MALQRLACTLVVTTLTTLALGVAQAQTTKESGAQIRQKTFDVVWKTVNDKYFDPQFGGVDWAVVRQRYAPQVATVKTDAELYDLLGRMLKEIRTSHLRILELSALDKFLARSVVTIGLALRDVDKEVLVTRVVEGSAADKAGFRTGFAVNAIDGVPVENAKSAETTLATETRPHRVTVRDGTGQVRDLVVGYELPPAHKLEAAKIITGTRYALLESRRIADGIGYIHFTNFITPLRGKLIAAFESMKTAPGIIVDLRGNSGGDELGLVLAALLVEKETQLAITRTRRGDDYSYKVKPQKNSFRGPVAILIDEESASESEQVTAGLQDAKRVVVIGRRSRGEDMDATLQELPMDTIALLYPIGHPRVPSGTAVEGRGVVPDIEVGLSRVELLNGKDSQLETAVEYLKRLKR